MTLHHSRSRFKVQGFFICHIIVIQGITRSEMQSNQVRSVTVQNNKNTNYNRCDSVIDITKWSQEYLQKPLSANTIRRAICRCQLKLYHAKRKPYMNMAQKRHHVLWAKAKEEGDLPGCYQRSVQKTSISDGMEVHKCIRYGQLACFGRHYEC